MRDLGAGSAIAFMCMNCAKRFGVLAGYPSASPPTSRVVVGFHTLVAREPLLAASDLSHGASGCTAAGRRFSGRSDGSCRRTPASTALRTSRRLRGLQRVSITLVDICIAHPRSLTTGGVRYKRFSKAPIEKAGGVRQFVAEARYRCPTRLPGSSYSMAARTGARLTACCSCRRVSSGSER
jgi:hypothetical protein